MTDFKQGDRVRLKAKPEITGVLATFYGGVSPWQIHSEQGFTLYRYPEELELVPQPLQVGDRVKHVTYGNGVGEVISEAKGWFTVEWDSYELPSVYPAADLVRV